MSQKTDVTLRDLSELSAAASMDTDTATIPAAISTTSANLKLAPGQYKVSLRNADATCHVAFAYGVDNTVTVTFPANAASGSDQSAVANGMPSMRGDEIERIRVDAAKPYVAFIQSPGATATTIVFTKVA
jgi:hypothetical protein